MGANAQFGLVHAALPAPVPESDQAGAPGENSRDHALTTTSLNPGAIYRKPFTMEEYLSSRILSDPVRLLDCVPMVNGGLAYIVTCVGGTGEKAHRQACLPPRFLTRSATTTTARAINPTSPTRDLSKNRPAAMKMAGVGHKDIDMFEPYDDYPMVVLIQMEDYGFCKKGEGGRFVEERDMTFRATFPSPPTAGNCPEASQAAPSAASCP